MHAACSKRIQARSLTKIRSLLFSGLIATASLSLPSEHAFAQSASASVPDDLRLGATFSVGDQTYVMRGTRDSLQRWKRARAELSSSGSSLAFPGRSLQEAHEWLHHQSSEGWSNYEIALIARFTERGLIPIESGRRWIEFIENWDATPEELRVQQHLAMRLSSQDSILRRIPQQSLPTEIGAADQIAAIASLDTTIPGRKVRSKVEPPAPIVPDLTVRALASESGDAMAAALWLAAVLWPHLDIVERYQLESRPSAASFVSDVKALTNGLLVPWQLWPQAFADLEALANDGFEIPNRWLWRIATHRYLMGDHRSLEDLLRLHARTESPSGIDAQMLRLLTRAMAPSSEGVPFDLPSIRSASNPTYRWVIAESMRRQGRVEEAERALQAIVDSDGQFIAAWLSLAAARNTLGNGAGVVRVVDVLEQIAPPLPIYAYWLHQLRNQRIER